MHFQFGALLDGSVPYSSECSWGAERASGDLEPESTHGRVKGSTMPKCEDPGLTHPPNLLPPPHSLPSSIAIRVEIGLRRMSRRVYKWTTCGVVSCCHGNRKAGRGHYKLPFFEARTVLVPFVKAISVPPSTSLTALPKCRGLFNCCRGKLSDQFCIGSLKNERSTHC